MTYDDTDVAFDTNDVVGACIACLLKHDRLLKLIAEDPDLTVEYQTRLSIAYAEGRDPGKLPHLRG